jgi:putative methanogenesis marker protein 8
MILTKQGVGQFSITRWVKVALQFTVSKGRVIYITEPSLSYCPLANRLHEYFKKIKIVDKKAIKQAIRKTIESKIEKYGFFTENRDFSHNSILVPYGASEMLMFALRRQAVNAAVVVCDGAGTVIVDSPEVVQGIGARMNSLVSTSPIKETIKKLKNLKCRVISENASIDQVRGVRDAVMAGYKKIAVTISGNSAGSLKEIRAIEAESGVYIIILVVCTTGIDKDKINLIRRYADIVWSCASKNIREEIGPLAILQISKQMPVFVLTGKGIDFISGYAEGPPVIKNLDTRKQYLVSNGGKGHVLRLGNFGACVREAHLPVLSQNAPKFRSNTGCGCCVRH